ncbi:MAG: long-chain fatty acid--CoA ligase [Planctomycetales bacterium]|nr:long-chain fatty acid--CoA ligase [Planctomycetales bacterium]
MLQPETIMAAFWQRVEADGERPAIHIKDRGTFRPRTWMTLADDVSRLGLWLRQQGVQPGDRVMQWSKNRYEWIVTDLATQLVRAVHVPVHAPLSAAQAIYQATHSGAKLAILGGADEVDKLHAANAHFPKDMPVYAYDAIPFTSSPIGHLPPQLASLDAPGHGPAAASLREEALVQTRPDDLATILYTSGTTGEPKGVMLCQSNIMSNVLAVLAAFDERAEDLRLAFLPLSHIFARTCDLYTWIARGSQLALAENRETIVADSQAFRPTLINGVPYFYERVQNHLVQAGLADVPDALRNYLGGRLRGCCSGGAALSAHSYDFFAERGVPLLQGYGLTETSPVISLSSPHCERRLAVGKPLPNVEVKIADDGEILTRGPHVMPGYWNDLAATEQILQAGWLHTGDLGQLDTDGFLFITGRKKELIVTATGKNIAPSLVESLLCRDPLIEQAMVLGDDRAFLSALIVPNKEHLKEEIARQRLWVWSKRRALNHPKVLALYAVRIERQLAELSHDEQVRRFVLVDRGFTLEGGHITPKASLRRDRIAADFAREIERLDHPTKRKKAEP